MSDYTSSHLCCPCGFVRYVLHLTPYSHFLLYPTLLCPSPVCHAGAAPMVGDGEWSQG